MTGTCRLGWFSTGRGSGSLGLLTSVQERILADELNAQIEFVFCSRERGETDATDNYLDTVINYGIPLVSFSYQGYRSQRGMSNPDPEAPLPQWRIDYDNIVLDKLINYKPDLCVLAGFMLITTPVMCDAFEIINLHPAAPGGPAGTWQQVIWKLLETKAVTQGIKMHVAIPELDMGPTATYCTFPIRGPVFDPLWQEIERKTINQVKQDEGVENALFKKIREHGAVREVPLTIATIQAFSEGKFRITKDRQIVDAAGRRIEGYDLTATIDSMVGELA